MAMTTTPHVFLIFGNGWIASQVKELLLASNKKVITSLVRIESREQVLSELAIHKPTRVINCAGAHGTPNADWCEDHKIETVRSNVLGVLNVVDCCFQLGIHITHFGSACIYDRSPTNSVFTEEDEPFYAGSWYSRSRLLSENSIRHYPNVLILRVREPIAADLHPNNLISKLFRYQKLLNMPGSGSVLPNLLPGAILLCEHAVTGIYNLISPRPWTNNEVMELAREHIRPGLAWENFGLDDMRATLKAPRCNPVFDPAKLVAKLAELGYEVKGSREALEDVFLEMKAKGL
ncbi:NAD(P)-binding protein [Biscogniauxia mediterranea]|nr:NAD(P)-binding protein [Biscogniauxia mediterranea]